MFEGTELHIQQADLDLRLVRLVRPGDPALLSHELQQPGIELLESHDEAQELAAQYTDEDDFEAPEIGRVEGVDLLALLGVVDIVEARGEQLALTHSGSSYLEKDIASRDELIALLPSS